MGLIKFLKNKFSKKVDETNEIEKKVSNSLEQSSFNNEKKAVQKYDSGMEKSRREFADKIKNLSKKYAKVNNQYFTELEEILIEADIGVNLVLKVIEQLLQKVKDEKLTDINEINDALVDLLFEKYMQEEKNLKTDFDFKEGLTTLVLVMGINGVGKTTTIAKLAKRYMNIGKKVLLVAADTFRAGAVEQLSIWASRLNCDIIIGNDGEDPASVVYKATDKAKESTYDLILVDTAGRIQTKQNLMNELIKMNKIITKQIPNCIQERILVLDATTGQNGVIQAKSFFEATSLSGLIITKMDGTSKGGIILSIKNELNVPVRFIGLGEQMDDLEPFDLEKYLYSLCVPNEDK